MIHLFLFSIIKERIQRKKEDDNDHPVEPSALFL